MDQNTCKCYTYNCMFDSENSKCLLPFDNKSQRQMFSIFCRGYLDQHLSVLALYVITDTFDHGKQSPVIVNTHFVTKLSVATNFFLAFSLSSPSLSLYVFILYTYLLFHVVIVKTHMVLNYVQIYIAQCKYSLDAYFVSQLKILYTKQ